MSRVRRQAQRRETDRRATTDRRSSERVAAELWVEQTSDGETYYQRGANISPGGIYIEQAIPQAEGRIVRLRFQLPGDPDPIEVRAQVVHAADDPQALGMNLRFVEIDGPTTTRIRAFVARCQEATAPDGTPNGSL